MQSEKTGWVERAHAIGDDLSADDPALLRQLAEIVQDWPATNIVARQALDEAALELLALAARQLN